MRARYRGLPKAMQQQVRRDQEYREYQFATLMIKLVLYVTATELSFGRKRLIRLWQAIEDSFDTMHTDPIYWDKLDRLLIDELKLDLPRCDCEFMERQFYRPPEVTADEAQAAVGKMAKMKEFVLANGLQPPEEDKP